MKDGIPWRVRNAQDAARKKAADLTRNMRKVPKGHNPHLDRGLIKPWTPTRIFEGQRVCIIGGGPSLKAFDANIVAGERVIVVNNAWKLVPSADLLHFADCEWWKWNRGELLGRDGFKGLMTTATSDTKDCDHPRLLRLWRNRNEFSEKPGIVFGWDSGNQAINLAYQMGAAKIVLFGFDMRPAADGSCNFHNEHKRTTNAKNYDQKFIPALRAQVAILAAKGIPVVRATEPGIDDAPFVWNWKWDPADDIAVTAIKLNTVLGG